MGARDIATALRRIADAIEFVDDKDVDRILQSLISEKNNTSPKNKKSFKSNYDTYDYDQLIINIEQANSREEGLAILLGAGITKAELKKLARQINISVLSSDTVVKLQEKIIEYLVGSRLASDAVRGRPLIL